VLFGSYALGQARRHSDVDFLVLLKKDEKVRTVRSIFFDFKLCLESDNKSKAPVAIQIVDFDEKGIEYVFELSTPLAHAARHGIVIWDDGWFKTLLRRPYPKWPTKEGALQAFTRWIVWQYYRCAVDLNREMLADHGPDRSINLADLQSGSFISRRYRNRRIGEFLKELNLTEGRGTGIPKILRTMTANGSPPPRFETDEDRTYFVNYFPVHPLAVLKGTGQVGTKPGPSRDQVSAQVTTQVTAQVLNFCREPRQEKQQEKQGETGSDLKN
jgi:hypothetical protein